jgi:hypothetical protein
VVGDEVGSGGGDEGGELFDEGEGFEDDSSGSVVEGSSEEVDDLTVLREAEALLGDRGSSA